MCQVYEVSIKRLLEVVEHSEEDNSKGVHTEKCVPLYDTRLIAQISNLEHNRVSLQDTNHFVEPLSVVMDLDAHEHLLCSSSLSRKWWDLLVSKEIEIVKYEGVLDSEEPAIQVT